MIVEIGKTGLQQARARIYIWPSDSTGGPIDVSADVKSLQTVKALDAPTGTFTIDLQPRIHDGVNVTQTGDSYRFTRYFELFEAMSVVSIGAERDGGIMLGLVTATEESQNFQTGDRTVHIQGVDLGITLEDPIIRPLVVSARYDQWKANVEALLGEGHPYVDLTATLGPKNANNERNFVNRSMEEVVRYILDKVGTMRIPALQDPLGGDGRIGDWLDTIRAVTSWDGNRVYGFDLHKYQGNIRGYLNAVIDPDFYELRIDSVPRDWNLPRPTLILRPRPFDESPQRFPMKESAGDGWEDTKTLVDEVPYHDIPMHEVLNAPFRRTGDSAIHFYQLTSSKDPAVTETGAKLGLAYPLLDGWIARKFASKRSYQANLNLVAGSPGDVIDLQADVQNAIVDKRNHLANWFWWNPYSLTCSATVWGRDKYRVGDRVRFSWLRDPITGQNGMTFYCTGVSQQWRPESYLTTLQLERGHGDGMIQALIDRIDAELPNSGYASVDL